MFKDYAAIAARILIVVLVVFPIIDGINAAIEGK